MGALVCSPALPLFGFVKVVEEMVEEEEERKSVAVRCTRSSSLIIVKCNGRSGTITATSVGYGPHKIGEGGQFQPGFSCCFSVSVFFHSLFVGLSTLPGA